MRALETKKMLNHHPRTRNEHAVCDEAQKVYLREQVVEVFQAGVVREEGVGKEVFGRFERGGKQPHQRRKSNRRQCHQQRHRYPAQGKGHRE
jgi:hypothetical protein